MEIDWDGRAYTTNRTEALRYRVVDADQFNQQQWYTKYVDFFEYHKPYYVLPPHLGKQKSVTNNKEIKFLAGYSLLWYQAQAIDYMEVIYSLWEKSGMIVSGTATWKSYILLGLMNLFKRKTCIVVPTKNIAKGLNDKFKGICNSEIVVASEIDKKDPDVMIISWLSFNKCYDKINERYDVLLLDETHRMSKSRVWQLNRWKWLFVCWVTATPLRKEYGMNWFEILFKNIYDTKKQSLPVKVFKYPYHYNYSLEEIRKAWEWLAPESPEIYRRLYIANQDRLVHIWGIIKRLREKWFKKIMIFTDRVSHTKIIQEYLGEGYLMTGATKSWEFEWKDEYIIIWMMQCAGEWFDVPDLEVGILYMSTSWENTLDQSAGRMRRKYKWKDHAIYIDFVDTMQFAGGKKKVLWRYKRNTIYKKKWREVLSFNDM